jgi:hypothetical protein
MSGFLVDTNAISEFVRPIPDRRVMSWFEAADPDSLFTSVVTFGEIRLGIEDMPPEKTSCPVGAVASGRTAGVVPISSSACDEGHRRSMGAGHD